MDGGVTPQGYSVYTIGYEGVGIDEFIKKLTDLTIDHLVDIRQLPLSRKKGFSKKSLKENLEVNRIKYSHLRDLGDPKEGRAAARRGDYKAFHSIFTSHMETPHARMALSQLSTMVKNRRVCLLCFERCHTVCHRSIVVEHLSMFLPTDPYHLEV